MKHYLPVFVLRIDRGLSGLIVSDIQTPSVSMYIYYHNNDSTTAEIHDHIRRRSSRIKALVSHLQIWI